MDIEVYEVIKQGLKDYIASLSLPKSYDPTIVGFEPAKPTYPLVIIEEVGNLPVDGFEGSLETIANLRYKLDIYAQQKVGVSKQEAARKIARYCDEYLKCIGLKQVSWNTISNDGSNGELYHIMIMYSANYFEQKQTILI